MTKTPLTVNGAEKLRAELHRLKTVDRPAVIAAIAEARSHGDLSENAEYDAAKERQGFLEGRSKDLEGKLSNAQIIDPMLLDADGRCVFGATVDLEDQESGDGVTYQIVGEDEADIKQGKLSFGSPMARALIGKEQPDAAITLAHGFGARPHHFAGGDERVEERRRVVGHARRQDLAFDDRGEERPAQPGVPPAGAPSALGLRGRRDGTREHTALHRGPAACGAPAVDRRCD